MKVVFFGATKFSEEILLHLLQNGIAIDLLFTIPKEFSISYCSDKVTNYNYADLNVLAAKYQIRSFEVDSKTGHKTSDYFDAIKELKPDILLVLGWYFMVPRKIRELAKYGAWGIHASLLPNYAGGAPLVWAIIEGQTKTGVTLFKLADGVDDGDIIAQKEIVIEEHDTIKEVYDKATDCSKQLLLDSLLNIDALQFKPQDKASLKLYPQRKPDDGEIDLRLPARDIYNFIRAQAPPYPGAFIRTADNKKLIIEKVRIEN